MKNKHLKWFLRGLMILKRLRNAVHWFRVALSSASGTAFTCADEHSAECSPSAVSPLSLGVCPPSEPLSCRLEPLGRSAAFPWLGGPRGSARRPLPAAGPGSSLQPISRGNQRAPLIHFPSLRDRCLPKPDVQCLESRGLIHIPWVLVILCRKVCFHQTLSWLYVGGSQVPLKLHRFGNPGWQMSHSRWVETHFFCKKWILKQWYQWKGGCCILMVEPVLEPEQLQWQGEC